jgi:hypothetical protein
MPLPCAPLSTLATASEALRIKSPTAAKDLS